MKNILVPAAALSLLLLLFATSCVGRPGAATQSPQDTPFDPGADRSTLVAHTWTFSKMFGQDIAAGEGRELPYLTFTADGKVQGHTGCNPLNGTYTLEDGLRIRFADLATGLAFCEDVPYENQLLEALNTADNYTLNDGTLSLNKARMAPLAILQAAD